jgi:hypothetical protein
MSYCRDWEVNKAKAMAGCYAWTSTQRSRANNALVGNQRFLTAEGDKKKPCTHYRSFPTSLMMMPATREKERAKDRREWHDI